MELSLNKLTRRYGEMVAVDDASIVMERGVYGLLGVNGAGKTTLMRMVTTLIRPSQGSITYDGKDIFELGGTYRRELGYLPQDFGYYPDLSVQDYLMYIAAIKGLREAFAKRRTGELLEQIGMGRHARTKMRKLSGGMLRRVGIAQAMMNDPKVLVLDEPTAGLDPSERVRFRNLIGELSEDRLVLLSTHIVSDIEFVANRIVLMDHGRLTLTGTPEEVVSSIGTGVWDFVVPRGEVNRYLKRYLVVNMKSGADGVELRVLAENPPMTGARRVRATLEDAFLFHFGEKAGE